MKHDEIFGSAIWVKAKDADICPVIRTCFEVEEAVKKATINILGLGTYVPYVNGKLASTDLFQPINSNFEHRDFPKGEVMAVRAYVNNYDITNLIKLGKNTVDKPLFL